MNMDGETIALIVVGLVGVVAAFASNRVVRKDGILVDKKTDRPLFPVALKTGAPKTATTGTLDDIYKKHGRLKGVDWKLLKAIARVESTENPNAVNPRDPSYGLMQILCTGADDKSFGGGACQNKFNISDWPPQKFALFDADTNVHYGSQIIAWNIRTYGMRKGIAVYNRWASRNESEPFGNQVYLDKVMREYNAL